MSRRLGWSWLKWLAGVLARASRRRRCVDSKRSMTRRGGAPLISETASSLNVSASGSGIVVAVVRGFECLH